MEVSRGDFYEIASNFISLASLPRNTWAGPMRDVLEQDILKKYVVPRRYIKLVKVK